MKSTKDSLSKTALFVTTILSVAFVFGFTGQSLADRYVDADGTYDLATGSCDGLDTCYSTIQSAINAASSEDVIVCPGSGSYAECITMKDGVNVISSGGLNPTISCSGTAATVEFAPQTASMACNLEGFEITHPAAVGAGVFLDGSSQSVTTTVSNCNIHDIFDGAGIEMNGDVNGTILDNSIYDCRMAGIGMGGPPGSSGALSTGSSVTIEGNTIGALSPNQNQEAGIFIMGSGSVTVVIGSTGAANLIQFNGESGIRLDTITDLAIDNNTIRNNTKAGILLIDVGTSGVGNEAIVKNNAIQSNSKAGINIGGVSYLTVGTNNIIYNNSTGGIAFNMGDVELDAGTPSSGPVTITGNNNISSNTFGGIGIIDAISTTNTVTITENAIYSNFRGGVGVQNDCKLEISKNTVRNNVRGGIKTGDDSADPGGFSGTPGSANLTIKQNKVHGNGQSGYGGGLDVRHADGTIYNNLVYKNHRGGIRFGDWIDEIVNNTVSDNGNDNGTPDDQSDDRGGGIVYDDISVGDAVNDPPEGALPNPNILIRNNILAFNATAGLRAGKMPSNLTLCPDNPDRDNPAVGDKYRDYNLVYANNATGETDCNWSLPNTLVMSCANKQYSGCGADWGSYPDLFYPNDMIADPSFVNRGTDNYQVQAGSPVKNAGDDDDDLGAYGGQDPITW